LKPGDLLIHVHTRAKFRVWGSGSTFVRVEEIDPQGNAVPGSSRNVDDSYLYAEYAYVPSLRSEEHQVPRVVAVPESRDSGRSEGGDFRSALASGRSEYSRGTAEVGGVLSARGPSDKSRAELRAGIPHDPAFARTVLLADFNRRYKDRWLSDVVDNQRVVPLTARLTSTLGIPRELRDFFHISGSREISTREDLLRLLYLAKDLLPFVSVELPIKFYDESTWQAYRKLRHQYRAALLNYYNQPEHANWNGLYIAPPIANDASQLERFMEWIDAGFPSDKPSLTVAVIDNEETLSVWPSWWGAEMHGDKTRSLIEKLDPNRQSALAEFFKNSSAARDHQAALMKQLGGTSGVGSFVGIATGLWLEPGLTPGEVQDFVDHLGDFKFPKTIRVELSPLTQNQFNKTIDVRSARSEVREMKNEKLRMKNAELGMSGKTVDASRSMGVSRLSGLPRPVILRAKPEESHVRSFVRFALAHRPQDDGLNSLKRGTLSSSTLVLANFKEIENLKESKNFTADQLQELLAETARQNGRVKTLVYGVDVSSPMYQQLKWLIQQPALRGKIILKTEGVEKLAREIRSFAGVKLFLSKDETALQDLKAFSDANQILMFRYQNELGEAVQTPGTLGVAVQAAGGLSKIRASEWKPQPLLGVRWDSKRSCFFADPEKAGVFAEAYRAMYVMVLSGQSA
jgi:hypothetical protein